MSVLNHLEPQNVFRIFEEMCAIPHGSGNTKAISDYCAEFAKARGLEYHQDAMNNIIIIKEAAAGYESAAPVMIQGHLDMVCEKAADCIRDMQTEGLDLFIDGDLIGAAGTTLGGDDGIAVAMALAVMDADGLPHPRIEAVFTVDEEIGMLGAAAMDVSPLRARRMLNIDSEEEGVFTVSCAGGNVSRVVLPIERAPFEGAMMTLTVSGLTGGHSGVEINKGRANANELLGRLLGEIAGRTAYRVVSVFGGQKDNAITVSASAVLCASEPAAVRAAAAELGTAFAAEYRTADSNVKVDVIEGGAGMPMAQSSSERVVSLMTLAPQGIQAMSADIAGLVQTSLNLGILETKDRTVEASFCVRSSIGSQKDMLVNRLRCLAAVLGGELQISGDYPGWAYNPDSGLRELMVEVYREQTGKEPEIVAIHAGVECGLFSGKLPGLDCISFGPNLYEIHTCRERMSISSVQHTWALLTEVLRRMK